MNRLCTKERLEEAAIGSEKQLSFNFNNVKAKRPDLSSLLLPLAFPTAVFINATLYFTGYQDKVIDYKNKFCEYIHEGFSLFIHNIF